MRPPQHDEPEITPERVDLRELFAVLRRNVWLLLAITAACVAVSAYFALRGERQFIAQAAVRLADPRRALTNNIADEGEQSYNYSEDRMVSQVQVLTSRSTAERALNREPVPFAVDPVGMPSSLIRDVAITGQVASDTLRLAFGAESVTARGATGSATAAYGSPLVLPGLRFTVAAPAAAGSAAVAVRDREEAVGELVRGLRARQRERSNVIEISYTGSDPRRAQLAVNAVAHAFAAGDVASAQGLSQRRRVFVEEQMRQNDSLLAIAQNELAAFRTRSGVFNAKESFTAEQRDAMTVDVQREALASERALYASLLDGVQRGRGGAAGADQLRSLAGAPGVASNPVISQLYAQLETFQTQRDSLTTGPWAHAVTHPDVQRLDTLIAGTEARLVGAARNYAGTLTTRIEQLDALKARSASAMQRLPGVDAEDARLNSSVESLRRSADQLHSEFQKARISESVQAGQVEIMDLATGPGRPVGSGPVPRLVLGLVVGLFLGGGASFLKERLDTTIARRSDVQRYLHVTLLGVIPRMWGLDRTGGVRGALRKLTGRAARPGAEVAASQAFVTVRTNLAFAHGSAAPGVIAVTSAAPEEGKSTVSSNLARVAAQQGLRVLLVDCDLRRPRIHAIFNLPRGPGLGEVLTGRTPFEDAVLPHHGVPNLSVLAAGSSGGDASDLMAGDAMRELLTRESGRYDLVLLDTPPVLAVADGAILGAMTDGVVMVVRAGRTQRDAAVAALEQLANVGARVTGAVINDPDDRVARYSGHYYYAEYYTAQPA